MPLGSWPRWTQRKPRVPWLSGRIMAASVQGTVPSRPSSDTGLGCLMWDQPYAAWAWMLWSARPLGSGQGRAALKCGFRPSWGSLQLGLGLSKQESRAQGAGGPRVQWVHSNSALFKTPAWLCLSFCCRIGQGGTCVSLVSALSVVPGGQRVATWCGDLFMQGTLSVSPTRCREHCRAQMPLEPWLSQVGVR